MAVPNDALPAARLGTSKNRRHTINVISELGFTSPKFGN